MRAFTLTELLVAIAVLAIVIIGTSKIFGTASRVTGLAQANQDILAESATIERQLREDIARLSTEGFFAIHCVAVRNDVRGAGQPLLNPNLAPSAILRADQLVFFANGVESTQTYHLGSGSNHKGQGTTSRVYYGFGFQLPRGRPFNVNANPNVAHDPDLQVAGPITPWWSGNVNMVNTTVQVGNGVNNFSRAAGGTIDGTQPEARRWLLLRQNVALMDDDLQANNDNSKTVYLGQTTTARSIWTDPPANWGWSREIRNGRADAAATLANEIRRWVTFSSVNPRPWNDPSFPAGAGGDERRVIQSAVYYPRAERAAPSTHRVDQALTNAVISGACSSFTIDWTYEGSDKQRVDANGNVIGGVGEVLDAMGNVVDPTPASPMSGDELTGVIIATTPVTTLPFPRAANGEQPWFGLPDQSRGVIRYSDLPVTGAGPLRAASTILPLATFPNNIESQSLAGPLNNAAVQDYWATFGYNQTRPLNSAGLLDQTLGYTPWPTALRITMVLHDSEGRLEAGREVQFVIDLPRKER